MREKEEGAVVITKATTKLVSRRNPARQLATRARTKVRLKPKSRKDWAGLSGEWSANWQLNQGTARAGTKSIQLRLAAGGATSPSQPNKKRPGWQAVARPKFSATWSAEVLAKLKRVGIQATRASRGRPIGRTAEPCLSLCNKPFNSSVQVAKYRG